MWGGFVEEWSRERQVGGSDGQELRSARSPSSRTSSFLAGPKPSQQKARLSISLWHGVRTVCEMTLCFAFETKGWVLAIVRAGHLNVPPPNVSKTTSLHNSQSVAALCTSGTGWSLFENQFLIDLRPTPPSPDRLYSRALLPSSTAFFLEVQEECP